MKKISAPPAISRSMSGISINSEMDDITPDDSISRGSVFNQTDDTQDRNVSATATATNITKTSKSTTLNTWGQSNLIFVKDDKYESNLEYLEGVMGVFQALL
jgi:hypothetical protein